MSEQKWVFVGTYTEQIRFGTGKILEGKGKGIYVYKLDSSSGSMELFNVAEGVLNPSYLAFHPSRRFVCAVNELKEYEGAATGAASAFSFDPARGKLTHLNTKPTHGTDPCHLIVDRTGRYVLVANFMSGSVCVLPVQEDGSLGDATDVIQHQGSSADPLRQSGPHAHAVIQDDAGRHVFVPDLGIDKLMVYVFDVHRGKLKPNDVPWVEVAAGAGPRQLVLHPRGQYAYLINELASAMTAYRYDAAQGTLREIQTLSTLPQGFEGASTCAEVQIFPSGRFLYGSNRGHDSIVIYAVDQRDGTLALIGHESTRGKTPRSFVIDPSGAFLLAANQDSDNVVTFKINPDSGALTATGHSVEVPTPVCVKVL